MPIAIPRLSRPGEFTFQMVSSIWIPLDYPNRNTIPSVIDSMGLFQVASRIDFWFVSGLEVF
jgi:hypothetical protein